MTRDFWYSMVFWKFGQCLKLNSIPSPKHNRHHNLKNSFFFLCCRTCPGDLYPMVSQLMQTTNLDFDSSLMVLGFPVIWWNDLIFIKQASFFLIVHRCHEINEQRVEEPVGRFHWCEEKHCLANPPDGWRNPKKLSSPACNENSILKPTTAGCFVLLCSLD